MGWDLGEREREREGISNNRRVTRGGRFPHVETVKRLSSAAFRNIIKKTMLHPIRSPDAGGAQWGCTQLDLLMQVGPSWAGWAPFRSPPTGTVLLGLQGGAHPIHSFEVGLGFGGFFLLFFGFCTSYECALNGDSNQSIKSIKCG